jgi:glycosyltransferase involved in cell wall biosynthesis
MPKVSVIIPNYNHARYLRQRIDSVLGQTFQDFEVILLDDCSTDESRSIISEYARDPRVRIEFNEKNSGSTFQQWNKGIRLAKGGYIWVAESDDYADKPLLERLVSVLDEEPEVAFAYCRSWRITQDGRPNGFADSYLAEFDPQRWTVDFRVDGQEECRNWFVFANSVPNASCVVFRKAVYDRVGGVDQSMCVSGDWKLWATMALEGRIAYVATKWSAWGGTACAAALDAGASDTDWSCLRKGLRLDGADVGLPGIGPQRFLSDEMGTSEEGDCY